MNKLRLRLDDLQVDTFHTSTVQKEKGTVFGEQCTCYTQCTCPGCPTCDASCNGTCAASCNGSCDVNCATNDPSCNGTCPETYDASCVSCLSCAKPWLCNDSMDYCNNSLDIC